MKKIFFLSLFVLFVVVGPVRAETLEIYQNNTDNRYIAASGNSWSPCQSFTVTGWTDDYLKKVQIYNYGGSTGCGMSLAIAEVGSCAAFPDYMINPALVTKSWTAAAGVNTITDLDLVVEDGKQYVMCIKRTGCPSSPGFRWKQKASNVYSGGGYYSGCTFSVNDFWFAVYSDTPPAEPEPEATATVRGPRSIIILLVALLSLIPGLVINL